MPLSVGRVEVTAAGLHLDLSLLIELNLPTKEQALVGCGFKFPLFRW
jgi:hypothetical protein